LLDFYDEILRVIYMYFLFRA